MRLGGINKNREHIEARKKCARCGHVFEDNEFKMMTDNQDFICEECRYKIDDYNKTDGEESGAMRKDEKTKTAEVLGRKRRKNYEQNLECVSRRGKKDAGADRSEYIREGERDETLQDAVTVQVDNKEEVRR